MASKGHSGFKAQSAMIIYEISLIILNVVVIVVIILHADGLGSEGSVHITMTSQWARLRLKPPASRLFTQAFIQAQIKENIKVQRHWPLGREFTGTGEFPAQMASNAENVSIWWRHHDIRHRHFKGQV